MPAARYQAWRWVGFEDVYESEGFMQRMIEVKTAELDGAALDWAVAQVEGIPSYVDCGNWFTGTGKGDGIGKYSPSTDWAQGGPLIEKNLVTVGSDSGSNRIVYWAYAGTAEDDYPVAEGATHLIAACRAIVASKLGDTVSVPAELLA